ncbi:MAG: hypothetical protein EOP88_14310 [Verrucomicrobiaceae bacterium]|nr:MAG: hypothetical protein EOP88_14310 [Verrucomicrobiaceae bacterium]
MQDHKTIKKAMTAGGFLARHALALGVLLVVPCVLWTAAYAGLLIWAMGANENPGGPLAYPVGLVVIATGTLGFGLGVCFPVSAVAEWVSHRKGWPRSIQFALALAMLLLVLMIAGLFTALQDDAPWHAFPAVVGIGFPVLVAPFTVYWGITQSLTVSWAVIRWVFRFFKGKDGQPPFPDYPRRPSEDGSRSCKALQ